MHIFGDGFTWTTTDFPDLQDEQDQEQEHEDQEEEEPEEEDQEDDEEAEKRMNKEKGKGKDKAKGMSRGTKPKAMKTQKSKSKSKGMTKGKGKGHPEHPKLLLKTGLTRKREYSRAYHSTFDKAIKQGCTTERAKQQARVAAQEHVATCHV